MSLSVKVSRLVLVLMRVSLLLKALCDVYRVASPSSSLVQAVISSAQTVRLMKGVGGWEGGWRAGKLFLCSPHLVCVCLCVWIVWLTVT